MNEIGFKAKRIEKKNELIQHEQQQLGAEEIIKLKGIEEAWKVTMSYLRGDYGYCIDQGRPKQFDQLKQIKQRYFDPI